MKSGLRTLHFFQDVPAQAENVPIYIQESFFSVYRDHGADWIDEGCPTDDDGQDVLRSILFAEAEAERMTAAGGIGVTLRFGAYYGNAMSQMMLEMARKRMLPQIGSGAFYVPSLHLDDAADAVRYALSAQSGVYNVCDDEPLLWRDFVAAIATAAHGPSPLKLPGFLGRVLFGYPWAWLSRSIRLNNHQFKRATGWEPRVRNAREGMPPSRKVYPPRYLAPISVLLFRLAIVRVSAKIGYQVTCRCSVPRG